MGRNVKTAWVSADALARMDCWGVDAHVHVRLTGAQAKLFALGDLNVRLQEGLRTLSAEGQEFFFYRPSHIVGMSLSAEGERSTSLTLPDHSKAVGPGDVVVSKFMPLRAAWVTQETPRYPVDSNCIRIVGLDVTYGFWVTAVLNHPTVREAWVQHTKGATIPRIGLKDLRGFQVPELPDEGVRLAELWLGLESDRVKAWNKIDVLLARAEELVSEVKPMLETGQKYCFQPAPFLSESWLPMHVALRHTQDEMSQLRWLKLRDFGVAEKNRLRDNEPASGRLLRLSDAEGILGFDLPKDELIRGAGFRVYEKTLQPEEVLVSLMGTSPKVIFNHPPQKEAVLVSDRWARLHSMKYPGALALLFLTSVVRWQLKQSSTGIAQQFVSIDDLESIRLPRVDAVEADDMHRKLCLALDVLSAVRGKQKALLEEVEMVIDSSMGGLR